jgi:inosine-uridine nucleoside N-ribohydrolase
VLALALLFGLEGKNEARAVSLSTTTTNLQAAAFCAALRRFYAAGGFFRSSPIGMALPAKGPAADLPMLTAPLARRNEDGAPAYPHEIHAITDTAEPHALIRNALTAQQDQSAIVVLAGPATNLVMALDLPGVPDLVARKVRYLVVMGGAFPEGGPEPHIRADVDSAKELFAGWPTPVVAVGQEVGRELPYPASSIERDFAWAPAHPVVDAYRAFRAMPYDAPGWDLTAVLYAVRPQESYFALSEPGTVRVLDDGRTGFAPAPAGKHRHLIFDPAQKERVIKTWTELVSTKPVPRRPRFGTQQQEQKKPPEAAKK